jgi:hypothetical protein
MAYSLGSTEETFWGLFGHGFSGGELNILSETAQIFPLFQLPVKQKPWINNKTCWTYQRTSTLFSPEKS